MTAGRAGALVRAATVGLSLGAVIAGLVLMALSLRARTAEPDCRGVSEEVCDERLEAAMGFAPTELWLGLGLSGVGVLGLGWQAWEDRRRRAPPPESSAGPGASGQA